jgi:hypothetical protein
VIGRRNPSILTGDSTCRFLSQVRSLKYVRVLYKQIHRIKPPSSHIHETLKRSRTIEAKLYRSNNVGTASRSINHERNHQSNRTVMLSDKYLWPVPELTPVHKAYKLALFQELVTSILGYIYTIEFQKCGLPHMHLLLSLSPRFRLMTA